MRLTPIYFLSARIPLRCSPFSRLPLQMSLSISSQLHTSHFSRILHLYYCHVQCLVVPVICPARLGIQSSAPSRVGTATLPPRRPARRPGPRTDNRSHEQLVDERHLLGKGPQGITDRPAVDDAA